MILIEKKMNLFEVEDKYYFAQCISADFAMGAGIAVEFQNRYKLRQKLRSRFGYTTIYPTTVKIDRVLNLITKERYWLKPTYETLTKALIEMREICIIENIKYLAMPKIGCGLDKLQWCKVREIIQEIFKDINIEILICYL